MRELRSILGLPRRHQRQALRDLQAKSAGNVDEAWNTRFGPDSLYEGWSHTTIMHGLYAHNRRLLRDVVQRDGFRIIEIGGGNGRLWSGLLGADARGELVLVDPVAEVHGQVRAMLPRGVELVARVQRVEDADLPEADAAIASLVLHHVAGIDNAQRVRYGFTGLGKREVLERLRQCIAGRSGFLLVNEADMYCELPLAPGDDVLVDRFIDGYVRRCARSLLDDFEVADPAERPRLEAIIRLWCIDQVAMADVPREQRDVYELDVPRWLDLFASAGFDVVERVFTDAYGLFVAYRAVPCQTWPLT